MNANSAVSNKKIAGGTLLVTGCCVGAGMIGLPILSALTGFFPTIIAMIFCYLFTTFTGLLLVEATLWFDGRVNLPTIVESTLGRMGKIVTICLFLFLFYCLFVAYLDAGGNLFSEMINNVLHTSLSHTAGVFACLLFVASIAYMGAKSADRINRVMLLAMIASYVVLVATGLPNVSSDNLLYRNWDAFFGVVPILLLCFGYQNLVPSLTYYMEKNPRAIRTAIVVGNFIPFIIYVIWNFVILGLLPADHAPSANDTQLVAGLLSAANLPSENIIFYIKVFSLFAMLTSFLPSALSFADFLKDGLSKALHQRVRNDFLVLLMVFIPPLICTLIYPRIFLSALSFAGGFIDVLLFGVLPALVVLAGRKQRLNSSHYQVAGGSVTPLIILALSAALLIIKIFYS